MSDPRGEKVDSLEHAKRLLRWAVAGTKSNWQYPGDREDFIEDTESFLKYGPPRIIKGGSFLHRLFAKKIRMGEFTTDPKDTE